MIRRQFLQGLASASVANAGAAAAQQRSPGRYDILIRNGEVRDPGRGFRQRADVGILDGKIAAIQENLPPAPATEVIDASGLYVTPGLVDMHAHVFVNAHDMGGRTDCICQASGVTTLCDAGSADLTAHVDFAAFAAAARQAGATA